MGNILFKTKRVFLLIVYMISHFLNVYSMQLTENEDINNSRYPKQIKLNEKIAGLSKLWSEIKYNFVNIDQISFDIDSLYTIYIEQTVNTQNDIEYYEVLQDFAASFNDSHTEVFSPYHWNEYNDYIPITFNTYDDGIFLVSIRKGSCLDSTFLRAKLLEVDNTPVIQWLKENHYKSISGSNERGKLSIAVSKMHGGAKNSNFNATVQKKDGKVCEISVKRDGEQTRTAEDQLWGIPAPTSYSPIKTRWTDEIAILEIKTFSPDKMIDSIDFHMMKIIEHNPKGLIIDLRNNRGGMSNVGFHLQKYLMKQDYLITFGWEKRINDGYGRSQGNYRKEYEDFYLYRAYETGKGDTICIGPKFPRITVPVAILINKNCFSACEDFLVNLYEIPDRPIFIGDETAGSTGSPLVLELPNGGIARICTLRITYPFSGEIFFKNGVIPDIKVSNSVDDDLDNYDRGIKTAIDQINSLLNSL